MKNVNKCHIKRENRIFVELSYLLTTNHMNSTAMYLLLSRSLSLSQTFSMLRLYIHPFFIRCHRNEWYWYNLHLHLQSTISPTQTAAWLTCITRNVKISERVRETEKKTQWHVNNINGTWQKPKITRSHRLKTEHRKTTIQFLCMKFECKKPNVCIRWHDAWVFNNFQFGRDSF